MEAYVTEVRAKQCARDLIVWVYEFPVEDPKQQYKGVSDIAWAWRRSNQFMPVAFHESTIATFTPVAQLAGFEPLSMRQRMLDMNSYAERTLLEKLIKESLFVTGQQSLNLKRVGYDLQEWQPKKVDEVLIYPALSLHVNITGDDICIGFHLTHKFEYNYTLQQMLERGQGLQAGMRVVHSRQLTNGTYTLERLTDYGVRDVCPKLKKSIYQYYIDLGDQRTVKLLGPQVRVVHALANNGTSLSYAASVLKPLCSFETMNAVEAKQVMDALKMKPDERMRKNLRQMYELLRAYPYLSFEKNPFLLAHNGYELQTVTEPRLLFNKAYNKPIGGLKNGRLYQGGELTLSIFMDETFERELGLPKKLAYKFVRVLQTIAAQHGVKITISTETRKVQEAFTESFFEQFSWNVQNLESIFAGTTVLTFISEKHLSEVPHNIYQLFKKQFGGKWDITSQVLTEKSLRDFYRLLQSKRLENFNSDHVDECQHVAKLVKEAPLSYTVFNILLGLYVKSGMQPWVLAERTHSDCFIGLDVSHEEGKSAAGIMNVIGSDGRLMKQSAIHSTLAGEKIDAAMLEEILIEVLQAYQEQFGALPKHVTIHRDGRWREDSAVVEQLLASKDIAYDIVEIVKKPNRRMAFFDQAGGKYVTRQGVYYAKKREALLCTTDPRENIGMAQPMKIVQKTKALTFVQIIEDVYRLSFMHIHALNKTRLPATVHYADLSSTAYQRGQIASRPTNVTYLPFV
ncbi:MAG: Piwi domain-containing protein [Solibacillus sp.]